MRSRFLRPLLVAILASAAVLPGTAASAHTSLSSTDPEQGAEVAGLEQVTLEFTGAVLDLGTTLALVQDDERLELEPTFPSETTVVAEVPALAAGDWSLVYRVVAEDGHPLEGQVDFTVVGTSPEPSATGSSESAAPTVSDSPSASAAAVPSPSPSATLNATGDEPGTGGWARIVGAAVLIAVAAGVIMWLRRRDGNGSDGDRTSSAADGSDAQE